MVVDKQKAHLILPEGKDIALNVITDNMDKEAYDQALILWNQGYMLDSVHQYLVKYNPEYWQIISI